MNFWAILGKTNYKRCKKKKITWLPLTWRRKISDPLGIYVMGLPFCIATVTKKPRCHSVVSIFNFVVFYCFPKSAMASLSADRFTVPSGSTKYTSHNSRYTCSVSTLSTQAWSLFRFNYSIIQNSPLCIFMVLGHQAWLLILHT